MHVESWLFFDNPNCIFRFMDLPTEIRLLVYEVLLVDNGRRFGLGSRFSSTGYATKRLSTPILCTCKSICEEALPILYGQNAFEIDTFPLKSRARWREIYRHFDMIGVRNAGLIRQVCTTMNVKDESEIWGKFNKDLETELRSWYSSLNIKWDQLRVWACSCRVTSSGQQQSAELLAGGNQTFVEFGEETLVKISEPCLSGEHWIAKKGSNPGGIRVQRSHPYRANCICEACMSNRVRPQRDMGMFYANFISVGDFTVEAFRTVGRREFYCTGPSLLSTTSV